MAQLSEKTADESIQFVASVSVGRRFTCHWFDASNPGGRIWTGTVSSIAADKKTMLVKYDNIEMLLPFPPVEAKVHQFAALGTVGYSTALALSEGGGRLMQFTLWDCASHGVYLNVHANMTHDDKTQRLMEYDRYLRQLLDIPLSAKRTQTCSENIHRMNALMLAVVAWATGCQELGPAWLTSTTNVTSGDYLFAALAALYVVEKKRSVKALATALEREPGIRGRLDACVTIAMGKKPGEDADSK